MATPNSVPYIPAFCPCRLSTLKITGRKIDTGKRRRMVTLPKLSPLTIFINPCWGREQKAAKQRSKKDKAVLKMHQKLSLYLNKN